MQSIRVFVALAIVISTVSPMAANASDSSPVVISELLTGTSANASQEFVELYNASDQSITVDGWTLEYKSATSADVASSWSKKATLSGVIAGHGFYLVAASQYYTNADASWTSSLAGTGGHVRLKDAIGQVSDLVGYGSGANAAEGSAISAPPSGKSLERLPGYLNPLGGNGVDTNNNVLDLVVRDEPQPQSTTDEIEVFDPVVPIPDANEVPVDDGVPVPTTSYPALEITELFVNPASPQSDDQDEFIELYNPHGTAVNLHGYQLRTGSSFTRSYVIPPLQLQPFSYVAFRSEHTGLSLTNSGGAVRLLDPAGAIVDQSEPYGQAPEGQSWSKFPEGWRWTIQPTLAKANIALAATPVVKTKKVSAKKAITKKAAKPKTTKPKAAKKPKASKKKSTSPQVVQIAGARLQPTTWLIILLAILTIGYASYEFRHDIRNHFLKLKGRLTSGRPGR